MARALVRTRIGLSLTSAHFRFPPPRGPINNLLIPSPLRADKFSSDSLPLAGRAREGARRPSPVLIQIAHRVYCRVRLPISAFEQFAPPVEASLLWRSLLGMDYSIHRDGPAMRSEIR